MKTSHRRTCLSTPRNPSSCKMNHYQGHENVTQTKVIMKIKLLEISSPLYMTCLTNGDNVDISMYKYAYIRTTSLNV